MSLRAVLGLACGLLGGCSVTFPMASLIPSHADDDVTGSIAKPDLGGWLDDADWTLAKPALVRALDSSGSNVASNWDNPASGAKGSFVALGRPYPSVSGSCRAFRADINRTEKKDDLLEGTACANRPGAWQVTVVKPTSQG